MSIRLLKFGVFTLYPCLVLCPKSLDADLVIAGNSFGVIVDCVFTKTLSRGSLSEIVLKLLKALRRISTANSDYRLLGGASRGL